MLIKNVPIIENKDEIKKHTKEEIILILSKSLIYDVKDLGTHNANELGMFINARYNKEDNTYYGDFYSLDLNCKKFIASKYMCIFDDNSNELTHVVFYVKKIG